jgi:hypothetical protein
MWTDQEAHELVHLSRQLGRAEAQINSLRSEVRVVTRDHGRRLARLEKQSTLKAGDLIQIIIGALGLIISIVAVMPWQGIARAILVGGN